MADLYTKKRRKPDNLVDFIYDVCVMHFDNGRTCVFDKSDYEKIRGIRWNFPIGDNRYPKCSFTKNKIRKRYSMHNWLINVDCGFVVDHINLDKSDNRRCNLRVVENRENYLNMPKVKNCQSKYKGVSLVSNSALFSCVCKIQGVRKNLGVYKSEEAAAHAYNEYVKTISPLCRLNEIPINKDLLDEMLITDRVSKVRTDVQSGIKNICWNPRRKKWVVSKRINKKLYHFGYYDHLDDAINRLHLLIENNFNVLN